MYHHQWKFTLRTEFQSRNNPTILGYFKTGPHLLDQGKDLVGLCKLIKPRNVNACGGGAGQNHSGGGKGFFPILFLRSLFPVEKIGRFGGYKYKPLWNIFFFSTQKVWNEDLNLKQSTVLTDSSWIYWVNHNCHYVVIKFVPQIMVRSSEWPLEGSENHRSFPCPLLPVNPGVVGRWEAVVRWGKEVKLFFLLLPLVHLYRWVSPMALEHTISCLERTARMRLFRKDLQSFHPWIML